MARLPGVVDSSSIEGNRAASEPWNWEMLYVNFGMVHESSIEK